MFASTEPEEENLVDKDRSEPLLWNMLSLMAGSGFVELLTQSKSGFVDPSWISYNKGFS